MINKFVIPTQATNVLDQVNRRPSDYIYYPACQSIIIERNGLQNMRSQYDMLFTGA